MGIIKIVKKAMNLRRIGIIYDVKCISLEL